MGKLKTFILYPLLGLLVLVLLAAAVFYFGMRAEQPQMYQDPVRDTTAAPIAFREDASLSILLFSKTNGFRHHEAIAAAKRLFESMAEQQGWFVYYSENAADFTAANLQQFDVVVFSNATQPHFSKQQQQALRKFIESGGGFVGIHSAGDSSHHEWDWYRERVIRASFTMHPLYPQFQTATLNVEDREHVASRHLPPVLQMHDEWYSFSDNPRDKGSHVIATLDESTYDPNFWPMGDDHPIVWWHELQQGRVFYSALGHMPEMFADPRYTLMLHQAILWAAD